MTTTSQADGGEVEVEYDGQAVTVPTTIRRSDLAGYFGSVANTCPVEYIYVYDGRLRAEGQADETTRVIATYRPDRVDSVGGGWDGWGAELVDGAAEGTPPNTLWERGSQEPMTDGGVDVADADTDERDRSLMDTLAPLAGEGRTPVRDLSHRDDPRLHIDTPAGEIQTSRQPDSVEKIGSATQRRWTWGEYRLEEERDGHPDLDDDERHAVVVTRVGQGD